MKRARTAVAVAASASLLVLALASSGIARPGAQLVAGPAGAALEAPARLATALALANAGTIPAADVTVTAIGIDGVRLSSPLPRRLGTIAASQRGTVFATFTGDFEAGKTYVLKVAGTFTSAGLRTAFAVSQQVRVPPAAPGSARATTAETTSQPHVVNGARYPHAQPNFPPDVNESHSAPVPTGTYRPPNRRPPPITFERAKADPPPINFFTNVPLGVKSYAINEPSGAVAGKIVFATANSTGAFSTDGGAHFTAVDPTTLFPQTDGGFCCDQVVQYVPSIDRIVWVLQYMPGKNANGQTEALYRLAAASPAQIQSSAGTSWTHWDITSTQLGDPKASLDYPDLSVGTNMLYLSFNQRGGRMITRLKLSEIKAGAPLTVEHTDPAFGTMALFAHPTQNALDEVFWAGHNTNSSMRVFYWPETSAAYFWQDVAVGTWPNDLAQLSSLTPDSQDWLTKMHFANCYVTGAARVVSGKTNEIWFAWTAPRGMSFKQPQVQWVRLDRNNNLKLIAQGQLWSSIHALAYAALASNANGEIGLSLEYGGGGNYENHVAGFLGDGILYVTTNSNAGITRYGDYVTIRADTTHPNRFDAFGFGLTHAGGGGYIADPRYIVFGRPGS